MPNTGIHALASDVLAQPAQGAVGSMAAISPLDRSRTVINSQGQLVDLWTVTVDNAVDDAVYTFTVSGVDISFTADGTATLGEITAGLVVAYNDNPIAFGLATATDADPDVVITGRLAGTAFLVSDSDANLTTVNTTPAADGDDIAFGRLLITRGFKTDEVDELGALAKSSLLTAQVDSYVMTYDALVRVKLHLVIEAQEYTASIVMAGSSDVDTEMALFVIEINLALPANSVIATYVGASDTIVLTAEVAGKGFTSAIDFDPPIGASVDTGAAVKSTTDLVSDDIEKAAVGISRRRSDVEVASIGGDDPVYPGDSGVQVQSNGQIWVESDETITPNSPVYVELGVAANDGKFFAVTSATRVLLSGRFKWQRDSRSSQVAIAVLKIAL